MEDELKRFNNIHEHHEEEYARMTTDMQGMSFSPGHQSEPATPPEYNRDSTNTSVYTSRHRYSSASLASPPGLQQRLSRSGSQATSTPSESANSREYDNEADKLPSKSVPASRRGSSDRFSQYLQDSGAFGSRPHAKLVRPFPYLLEVHFSLLVSCLPLSYSTLSLPYFYHVYEDF